MVFLEHNIEIRLFVAALEHPPEDRVVHDFALGLHALDHCPTSG